jgi:uncharacterized protein YjdB
MKNLAKRLGIISLAAVIGFSMAGCGGSSGDDGGGNVAVTGVSLNKTNLSLNAGETERFTASISPSSAANKKAAWNTSNPAAATVLPNGLVSGISFGTFQGTISASDFHSEAFLLQGSDLREKYLAGGIGTYARANGEDETATWTKQ